MSPDLSTTRPGPSPTSSKPLPSAESLLLVFSSPSPTLPLPEFHTWYDDEHIPNRLPLPGFRSATRLQALDSKEPEWGAIYDIQSMDVYDSEEYKSLGGEGRSENEKSVMRRLGVLDRRIYKRLGGIWQNPRIHTPPASDGNGSPIPLGDGGGGNGGRPIFPKVFVIVSLTPKKEMVEEFHQWYLEEHIEMLSQVPGWVRSRRFELVERSLGGVPSVLEWMDSASGASSGNIDEGKGTEAPPRFLAIHEYEDSRGLTSSQWAAATSTPWRMRIMEGIENSERRVFGVWKVFK